MTHWNGQPDYFDDSGFAAGASWNIGTAGGRLLEALSLGRPLHEIQALCKQWSESIDDIVRIGAPATPSTSTSVAIGDALAYAKHLMVAATTQGYPVENIDALAWSMVYRDHAERFYAWLSLNLGCSAPSMIKPLPPPVINWPKPPSSDAPKPETTVIPAKPSSTVVQLRPGPKPKPRPPRAPNDGGAAA